MSKILLLCVVFCLMLSLTIGGDTSPDLSIPKTNGVVKNNANFNYTRILDFWKKHKREFELHDDHKEVVVVMGNTGSGKTTLVSALVGRKLKVIRPRGNFFIVDDENKIGTGITSKTLVPDVMIDSERNVTYIDCSGFRDNRPIEYEISSVYFQNSLMNQVEKIKLILVIEYNSLKLMGNKNDFDDLLEHIGEFVKDLSKFHSGIALVATKVENTYEIYGDGRSSLSNPDQLVLDDIADFLKNKKELYLSQTENFEKYQKFANLIDVLLQKNEDSYSRIAIFRQPTARGLLENMSMTKNQINTIIKMITENLHYVKKQNNDFGFALSKSYETTVDKIIDDIFKNALTNRLQKIENETHMYYLQMEKQHSDIRILHEQISYAYDLISELKNDDEPEKLFVEFLNVVNTLNIPISLSNLDIISDDIKILQFFTTVSNNNEGLHMRFLKDKIQNITNLIENKRNFYKFLNNLEEHLSFYNSQKLKNDHRIKNILASCKSSTDKIVQEIPDLESIVKEIGSGRIDQKIKTLKLNQFQLKHLQAIFSAFTSKPEISCASSSESMIVKGYNVKIGDVVESNCWLQAKSIQIFALNKVFIDRTINKTGAEAEIIICAPTWEVFGEPKIILDGKAGELHKNAFAKSASSNGENGANGLPGLPGGSAGNFFGVGKRFINLELLEIHANGGNGSPGQHGGDGANGISGEEIPDSFFTVDQMPEDVRKYFNDHHFAYKFIRIGEVAGGAPESPAPPASFKNMVIVQGKPAVKPTNGGDGGVGGKGGYPGRIIINGLGKTINVKTSNNTGSIGLEGQGGNGGNGAFNGRELHFNYSYGSTFMYFGWFNKFSDVVRVPNNKIPAGKYGNSGSNKINQKYPTPTTLSLYPAVNSFKNFVRINLFENIKESALRSFVDELENDNQIKAQYNTLAFVKELEGLENQLPELRNKIDFVPFYNSFLNRVEDYATSEKILENKKVLSYLYTAALTKMITLNEKSKGRTVVDLSKYLDTVKNSLDEINKSHHLQIVQKYQNDFEKVLNKKIKEANNFIQNTIEPEINELWDESDNQIREIVNEINENRNSTKNALETLTKDKARIRDMILLRSVLSPLKLAVNLLSFTGPVGAVVGVGVTGAIAISEGVVFDTTSSLGENKIYSLDPNLKLMSRVTEVYNNKHKSVAEKLNAALKKLEEYEKELSLLDKEKKRKIKTLRTQLQEVTFRKVNSFSESVQKLKDTEEITRKITTFTNSEKDFLEKKKEEEKKIKDLVKEKRYERRLRLINNAQSILNSVEIVFSFSKRLENDEGMINKINNQISENIHQLEVSEKMENQMYDIIIPDLRQIEETINTIKNSLNGSSHVKLDLTKWNVRTTLRDVKSLLQKFTRKMTFELQSNLQRHMDKIDEAFSILIDIYDRIDSYSDTVKQAEYIAHIESASMDNVQVTNAELSKAVNDLKLTIHSNILTEKYEIALHAFKQHYFPFAAGVLERFQLPTSMQLNDTEILRSNIIAKIKEMKNHIKENEATIGGYSKYIHSKSIFNSNTIGSSPFYVWKHDTIKSEIQRLLNGSEIVIKADISKGPFYNAIKYNDIGINFKFNNKALQSHFTSVLKNFALSMTMIGNNYYRCGERYYFISVDDDITIYYNFNQDEGKKWINPNDVYTLIHRSHTLLSPYGMWSIKLHSLNDSVSFDDLNVYANETIDLELIGQGYYIDQNADFNFEFCNERLGTYYEVENIVKVLP